MKFVKYFNFFFFLTITLTLAVSLNQVMGDIPALGKLLSPFDGVLQNAKIKEIPENSTIELELPDLTSKTRVYFDQQYIPHIYAQNNHDLYYTQGYLTAKDRLWQMDILTRKVYGRLSEIMGPATLNMDRLSRRTGLKKMTQDTWQIVCKNPELKAAFEAYADGVNAYINTLDYEDYPLEFKLANYAPELWTPEKSCMAYALLSSTLSRSEADLENTNALSIFGEALFNELYPEQRGNLSPVIPKGTQWNFKNPLKQIAYENVIQQTNTTISKPSPLYGSNNFAVSGSKTKNGNPIFANEPDLELTLPSIWYAVHQHTPSINTMGVTVPGTPVILIGFNDSLAWGVTNSPRDQIDWYAMNFKNSDRKEYQYNHQWFKTEKIIEAINVKDKPTYYDTIVFVHHGPIVYDRNFMSEDQKFNYAMRWVAHDPGQTIEALYNVNRSGNKEDFEKALSTFNGPPQNFLFATITGDIGTILPGKFPNKPKGKGKFLLDGSKTEDEWPIYIPYEHKLSIINPERGFVSSANQHPVDSLYPYYIYDHHYEYYRNRRINDRLTILDNIVPRDMMKLQNDNFNHQAYESLPTMLEALDTIKFTKREWDYYSIISSWDHFNEPELKAPTLYQIWWDLIYQKLWAPYDAIDIAVNKPNIYNTIYLLQNEDSRAILQDKFPEFTSVENLYNTTFNMALDSLENWQSSNGDDYSWYIFKNTTIKHMIPKLQNFSYDHAKIGGGKGIVNAASAHAGPSWRMVVELDPKGVKAWGIYPGSQTGAPSDPKFGAMIDKWAAGEYFELLFGQDISNSNQIHHTIIYHPE